MKYLITFQVNDLEAAVSFDNKKSAKEYIEKCATAAKSKAFENSADNTFIIELKNGEDTSELKASLREIDTNVKYELSYEKNGEHVETSYYQTRAALVKQAKSIIDELGYEPSQTENDLGQWSIDNADSELKVSLIGKLVLTGNEEDNVVSSYDCVDMVAFCKNPESITHEINALETRSTADTLKSARKKGLLNLGIGAAITIVGGLLSLASYNNARPGEKYTVYTGLIVIGIIDACCGLYQLINPKSTLPKEKRQKNCKK